MKRIVMVPPVKFDVQYEINPWMVGNKETVDRERASKQWTELYVALRAWGAEVILLDPPPDDCPDAVFSANAGLAQGNLFITSRFKHPERQVEEPYFAEQFKKLGFVVLEPDQALGFEGAGDALFDSTRFTLWLGSGFRTDPASLEQLQNVVAAHVELLTLVDPRFYHLDTAFCPLDDGRVLWYPEAFDQASQAKVRSTFKTIDVGEEDAVKFACNAISLGDVIVLPLISDELFYDLTASGLKVVSVCMDQFLRSGGACKCLTLELA